jgi:hypothetical protein
MSQTQPVDPAQDDSRKKQEKGEEKETFLDRLLDFFDLIELIGDVFKLIRWLFQAIWWVFRMIGKAIASLLD